MPFLPAMYKKFVARVVPSRSLMSFVLIAFTGILSFAHVALADPIPVILAPGESTTAIPKFTFFTYDPLLAYETSTFGSGTSPTGVLTSSVKTSSINPFGSAGDTFVYSFTIANGTVASADFSGFSGLQTAFRMSDFDGGYVDTTSISRSADGNIVTFNFASGVTGNGSSNFSPGNTVQTLSVYTNATNYVDPPAIFRDVNGNTAVANTFSPAVAPEPATWILSLCSVGFLGIWKLKQIKTSRTQTFA